MAPTNVNGHIVWEALGPAIDSGWEEALLSGPWYHAVGWQTAYGSLPTTLPPLQTRVKLCVWGGVPGGSLETRAEASSPPIFLSWRG